ncbi:hypothetical protein IPP75_05480 [Candidatus Saccharibacteria bacterium]|nr:MAG: hypothetical protein IPP75_05480 [Candidatus Saccharibacteria bacterium]
MKTTVVTLQGQDFILSTAAEPLLVAHLKELQRLTRFRSKVYRQNVEALRDVLLTEGGETISKTKLHHAIELVGLPEKHSSSEPLSVQPLRLTKGILTLRLWAQKHYISRHNWLSGLRTIAITVAVFFAVGTGTVALQALSSEGVAQGRWEKTQTTLGAVRSWAEPNGAQNTWSNNWQPYALLSGAFLLLAVVLYREHSVGRPQLHRPIGIVASLCLILLVWQTRLVTPIPPPKSSRFSNSNTAPLHPRLAYLQQCGDEIPYVFDNETNGMLFRQLRDQGFQLGVPIQTRMSDGTIDTTQLCSAYDALRRDHPKQNVVLQMYTTTADGTLRPYDFGDIQNQTVNSNYGLFVKS